ncbi:MAG: DUF29 domain-containing protein [Pseudanabaena sp.]|jgi:hypothetical protein|nr:DUF29 domain-containing protein [Pseudanabaena sp. M090S1SP2A07QC]MCA6506237.1 DUF29 domain-containing protein [Pseudanabaena sp. M172S2SP2A07QC]MCA6524087.1 DUF29 domain-containing protein [Pseudanabaena sp. M051S1SP2A07QC]MCA6526723.1 DUF29 domain-containing protein [Pseudanabaena sp. M179S2SP2A07QC]MCA6532129.1 DUF29 domain-containing protein [Pseudanabaena sp. M125S2SP2A07QC]MCA6534616.1 DUF29 domain-containing protein [Pseudanabaena sp. M176S2SP2A07QC]MCA6537342.1 DUF29 domain-contain
MTQAIRNITTLYENDFVAWCEATAAKLRNKELDDLDFENLIEEVENLARSDRRELKNRLVVLFAHLLKRIYVNLPENFNGWELTIIEQRQQIKGLLQDSPSLKPYFLEILSGTFENALELVKSEYKQTEFPSKWQLDSDANALLSQQYWLSQNH